MLRNFVIVLLLGFIAYFFYLETEFQRMPKITHADALLPDGSRYYGELKDGLLHGPGELRWENGNILKASFEYGLVEGEGEYSSADGSRYKGEFKHGMYHGKGRLEYPGGDWYEGDFEKNRMHGVGTSQSRTGDRYDGEFSNNVFHGEGVLVTRQGTYSGQFEQSEFVSGTFKDEAGNEFAGQFKNWMLDGAGVYRSIEGEVFKGTFVEGVLQGEGEHKNSEGEVYTGEFKDFYYSGMGKLELANGDTYEGEFDYGQFHGEGRLHKQSESGKEPHVVSGTWRFGELQTGTRKKRDNSPLFEKALYEQNALLKQQSAELSEGEAGKIELFFLGLAGYGRQKVFLEEVTRIVEIMEEFQFSQNRNFLLVNHYRSIEKLPLATKSSLNYALEQMAGKMNLEEDILFLYLTSHGSKDHQFSLQLDGVKLPDISAADLASSLESSPIKWKVIFISACYSGGFIPDLESDSSLVITAARKDRKSFGCSDDSSMTYFARAYFEEALDKSGDFISAFHTAEKQVKEWEERDFPESEASLPQISVGAAIEQKLHEWQQSLENN